MSQGEGNEATKVKLERLKRESVEEGKRGEGRLVQAEERQREEEEEEEEEEEGGEAEEEGVMSIAYQPAKLLKCPITLKEIEIPMKNRECGHIFEKIAIETLLVQHLNSLPPRARRQPGASQIKCPVAGCRCLVYQDSIERDIQTEAQQRRLKRRRPQEEDESEEQDLNLTQSQNH
eukprot:TRINITY_DN2938_c0_g1_i4.p1 TRINITY_DN2938_c0_g1~~TRINITY_DN2938_c0_g1_i4.p1  ORF type:complete len:194 (-),score=62.08 TRINITY_DN2938_c0_g1_i4:41-568(-)